MPDAGGTEVASANQQNLSTQNRSSGKTIHTQVYLLDGSLLDIYIERKAKGEDVLGAVCQNMNIVEKDYFGLTYDAGGLNEWLPLDARVAKYIKGEPWRLTFEVKFYPPDPSLLHEDITRYHLCLQIRNDILSGKVQCSFMTYALLGSYLVQSELGDYDPMENSDTGYLKDFRFAPEQTHELEQKVAELHKTHKGQTPAEAELHYLENAKKLAMYGVDTHPAKDSDNVDITLGVSSAGIQVFRDHLRINRFAWPKILKISYKRNNFYIKIRPGQYEQSEPTIIFRLGSHKAAKRLWKTCVEHHTFFRLTTPEPAVRTGLMPKLGSRVYYSGRTLYESKNQTIDRQQPQFLRSHSTRKFGSHSMEPVGVNKRAALEAESKRHTMPIAPDHIPGIDSNTSPANKRLRDKKPVGGIAVLPMAKHESTVKGTVHTNNTNGLGNHHDEDEAANEHGGVNRGFIAAETGEGGGAAPVGDQLRPGSPDRLGKLKSPMGSIFSWRKSGREKKTDTEKRATLKEDERKDAKKDQDSEKKDTKKEEDKKSKDKKKKKEAIAVAVEMEPNAEGRRSFWSKKSKGDKGEGKGRQSANASLDRSAAETTFSGSPNTTLNADSTFDRTADSVTLEGSSRIDDSLSSGAGSPIRAASPGGRPTSLSERPVSPGERAGSPTGLQGGITVAQLGGRRGSGGPVSPTKKGPGSTFGKETSSTITGRDGKAVESPVVGGVGKGKDGSTMEKRDKSKEGDVKVEGAISVAGGQGLQDVSAAFIEMERGKQSGQEGEPSSPVGTGTKGMKAFAPSSEKSKLSLGGLFGRKDKSKGKDAPSSPEADDKKKKGKDKDKKGKDGKGKSDKDKSKDGRKSDAAAAGAAAAGAAATAAAATAGKESGKAAGANSSLSSVTTTTTGTPDQSLVSDKDRSMDSTLVEAASGEQGTPGYTKPYQYIAEIEEEKRTRLPGAFSYESGRLDDLNKDDRPVSPGSRQTGLAFNYAPGEDISQRVSPARSSVSTFKSEESKDTPGTQGKAATQGTPGQVSQATYVAGGDSGSTSLLQDTPKVVKTTTKQSVIKDKGEVTQNIQQKIEDLNSKEVWFNEQHNKAEGLTEGGDSPYIQATSVTTRTATTHEDVVTNAKTSEVEEKTVARSTTMSGGRHEQRVVTQQVRATTSTLLNDQLGSRRRDSNSSTSSDDSGTPIDGDNSADYFVNSSFQEPIIETETKVYEAVESGDGDNDRTKTTQVPLVPTQLVEPGSYTTQAEIISSQIITSKTRTVETTTYKTEKDGQVETRVEQKITIQSDGDPIDHDKALAEAIQEAAALNPNMTVEKIEIQQQ